MYKLPYGLQIVREVDNSVHSIDKLILRFYIDNTQTLDVFNSLVDVLQSSSDWRLSLDSPRNGYKDKRPSSHYSWFQSSFWCDGLNVKIGEFSKHGLKWWLSSVVQVEFNPNKSFLRIDIGKILQWLIEHSKTILLKECDYAVDIPCKTSSILVQSTQDHVSYNDSHYYGKRHINGRIKVYNKRKEVKDKEKIDIGHEITRCEYTCTFDGKLDFGKVGYYGGKIQNTEGLSTNLRSICNLLYVLQDLGQDTKSLLMQYVPDKRNRDKLIPCLFGDRQQVFDVSILQKLLTMYKKLYIFEYRFEDVQTSRTVGGTAVLCNDSYSIEWGSVGND